jgi:hypothetical protein
MMSTALVMPSLLSAGHVYGTVDFWKMGCGHIVSWDSKMCATSLPNPNVQLVYNPSKSILTACPAKGGKSG